MPQRSNLNSTPRHIRCNDRTYCRRDASQAWPTPLVAAIFRNYCHLATSCEGAVSSVNANMIGANEPLTKKNLAPHLTGYANCVLTFSAPHRLCHARTSSSALAGPSFLGVRAVKRGGRSLRPHDSAAPTRISVARLRRFKAPAPPYDY